MRNWLLGLVAAALFLGCPAKTEIDAGVPFVDAAVEVIDAGPPRPLVLEPTITISTGDAGVQTLVAETQIDPISALTISLPVALRDFRVRLLDWRDQIVASDDELMPDGRTYVITLSEPLKTGRSYRVVIDAELGPIVTTESGQEVDDWELKFRIAGDVVPDPSSKPSRRPLKRR